MTTIQSVEEATQLAMQFARRYYSYIFPISTKKEHSRWIVDLDISYYKSNFLRLRIDQETGTIEDFKVTHGQLL